MDHLEPLSGDAKSISHISVGFIILVFETALFLNSSLFCFKNCPRAPVDDRATDPEPFYNGG